MTTVLILGPVHDLGVRVLEAMQDRKPELIIIGSIPVRRELPIQYGVGILLTGIREERNEQLPALDLLRLYNPKPELIKADIRMHDKQYLRSSNYGRRIRPFYRWKR